MPTFLKNANAMDRCRCDLCGQLFPKALIHEHHIIKRASGGKDTRSNVICLDASCHNAIHQVEAALRNNNRRGSVADLVGALFPNSIAAQRRCLELAALAAMGVQSDADDINLSIYDTNELVYLPPVKVSPKVRALIKRVMVDTKNPKTGKRLGMSEYIRSIIEADLKKRGFTF